MGKCFGNICKDIVSHVCLIYGRIYFKYMYNYMELYTWNICTDMCSIYCGIHFKYVKLYGIISMKYMYRCVQ